MKPIDQNTFGAPGGNCFSACVASLLEISINEVPYFMEDQNDWWDYFSEWLKPFGFYPLCFVLKQSNFYHPSGYHILSGQSSRGPHSVVAFKDEIIHDPHPEREGLLTRDDIIILVPFDPSKTLNKVI